MPENRHAPASAFIAPPRLFLTRVFAARAERVWRAWIRPEEMVRWLGPVEWPATLMEADVRVGGAWRACLSAREGQDVLWQSGRYLEIEPPNMLRFTFRWDSDDHEDAGVETVVTVTFESLDSAHTRLTLVQEGLTSAGSVGSHAHGWGSTLDRLGDQLQSGRDLDACN